MSGIKAFFSGVKKIYSIVITVVVILFLILWALDKMGADVEEPVNKAIQKVDQAVQKSVRSDEEYIAIVKEGKLFNTDVTVGEVFDTMYAEPTWKHFTSDGKNIVEFNGMYYSQDTNYSLMVQFLLSGDGRDSFQIAFMHVDGRSLSDEQKKTLLDSIYNEYETIKAFQ
jgi:hypothetical protein